MTHRAYVLETGATATACDAGELGDRDALMASYLGQTEIEEFRALCVPAASRDLTGSRPGP